METVLFPRLKKKYFTYGTAGFRDDASLLDSLVYRCGILMAIRAQHTGHDCGVMITASHNPINDNGVKLIDYTGEMINSEWENYANLLINSDDLIETISKIPNINPYNYNVNVLVGHDTRPSSKHLADLCMLGISVSNVNSISLSYVTTPELQFNVQYSIFKYYQTYEHNKYLMDLVLYYSSLNENKNCLKRMLHIDCANGVGAQKLQILKPYLESSGLLIQLYNYDDDMNLNYKCGADYVEKELTFPTGMENIKEGDKCCSLDGDADRIVYFTKKDGKFVLLNGDKIAILMASFLSTITTAKIGIVQTAYANGASTRYIREKLPNVDIECTSTGVKYLHSAAKKYDIGIYFEANGHGTVLVNKTYNNKYLNILCHLMSQVTGDALANILFVETILYTFCSFEKWIDMYTNLPSKQYKMNKDRSLFQTIDSERKCIKPEGLQDEIDNLVKMYKNARCFVRPSGTENAIRIYVEGDNTNDVDTIMNNVIEILHKH